MVAKGNAAIIDLNTALPVYIFPVMTSQNERVLAVIEMTTLRGLDGVQAGEIEDQTPGQGKPAGQSIRDEGVIEHFKKQVMRGLLDIDERERERGQPSIFTFEFNPQANGGRYNGMIIPPRSNPTSPAKRKVQFMAPPPVAKQTPTPTPTPSHNTSKSNF